MPTRHKIQEQFLEHVMAHAPGYKRLIDWTDAPIMPTPGAVGEIIQTVSAQQDIEVVGVDIGGATTDVFSVFKNKEAAPIFNRTVSANLGMSYSVSNVLAEAGLENVLRWVPFDIEVGDLRNRVKNKMIRPTTIPQTLQELMLEQAIAREALRLAFEQHRQLAVEIERCATTADYLGSLRSDGKWSDACEHARSGYDRRQWWRFIACTASAAGDAHDDRCVSTRRYNASRG